MLNKLGMENSRQGNVYQENTDSTKRRSKTQDATSTQQQHLQSFSYNVHQENKTQQQRPEPKQFKTLDEQLREWHQRSDALVAVPHSRAAVKPERAKTVKSEDSPFAPPGVGSSTSSWSYMKLYNQTFTTVHPRKHDPEKEQRLKQQVKKRALKGATVAELVKEPLFDDVLDICDKMNIFPAHPSPQKVETSSTLDAWRALSKCRYLRVSDMNIRSLKEATLEDMINSD